MNNQVKCYGCGALVENINGGAHEYIGALPGCWAIFGDILAKEYSNPSYFHPAHRLTVDTYAVQHPGVPSRKSIQSVNVHLAALYLAVEKKRDIRQIPKFMSLMTKEAQDFVWLEPPVPNGIITVLDVVKAEDARKHQETVKNWAEDVWLAWETHHSVVKQIVAKYTS